MLEVGDELAERRIVLVPVVVKVRRDVVAEGVVAVPAHGNAGKVLRLPAQVPLLAERLGVPKAGLQGGLPVMDGVFHELEDAAQVQGVLLQRAVLTAWQKSFGFCPRRQAQGQIEECWSNYSKVYF